MCDRDYRQRYNSLPIEKRLGVEALATVIINFDSDGIDGHDGMVNSLIDKVSCLYAPKMLDFDLKNKVTPLAKPFNERPPILKLKALLSLIYIMYSWGSKKYCRL